MQKAFELLSDPGKRRKYDRSMRESEDGGSAPDVTVRPRSYKERWRAQKDKEKIYVSQVILDRVNGLSADYEVIENRTSVTVPVFGLLGMLLYLFEPGAIYASDVFLVDLFLCTAIGGIYGYLIGNAWGYADLYFWPSNDT